jgi:hypothetical protein
MGTRLSVMMPVYNGATYVGEAIDSVLRQTLGNFEFLIMDDGSTDETPYILKRYAERDRRIRLHFRSRQGQIACRNELLELAGNDIVACADADDICLPDRFERQLPVITSEAGLLVLGSGVIPIDAWGRRGRPWRTVTGNAAVARELEHRCCIAHPTCMMRRKDLLALGGYRLAYESAEDYDLFLRATEHGKVDNLAAVGVLYRRHEESVSSTAALRQAVSADLARASHSIRVSGKPDTTQGLLAPPGLEDPVLLALLLPAQMELHRAMAVTYDRDAGADEIRRALAYLLHAPIGRKQALPFQRAVVRLIGRLRFDLLSLRVVARAVARGPGRFVRLLLKRWRRVLFKKGATW